MKAAVSAGGVSPSPLKLRGVEAALAGKTPADIEAVCGTLENEIDPTPTFMPRQITVPGWLQSW